jgi:phospholipase C
MSRRIRLAAMVAAALAFASAPVQAAPVQAAPVHAAAVPDTPVRTTTPIQHVLVVFQENVSFDHYFGTYPKAANPPGEPAFHPRPGTPRVNGLTGNLRTHNPNSVQPFRLDRSQALTCDQDHGYTDEQKAFDDLRMDKFVEHTSVDACSAPLYAHKGLVMGYYDGNTVTALWRYAQRFAMNDNSFNTTFGPSTPGMLNVASGQTWGATAYDHQGNPTSDAYAVADPNAHGVGTVINDPDPTYDDCSNPAHNTIGMAGRNVGDLLNARHVTWGAFMGGFAPTTPATATTPAACGSQHANIGGVQVRDYIPHHEWFQYYKSTANPHHLAPASLTEIGRAGRANHNYDLPYLYQALDRGVLPSVSYVKASAYQDGHAAYSDPLDEQRFLVDLVNRVQRSRYWENTAIVIAYDDSDGWYDHAPPPIVNPSNAPEDALTAPGVCGHGQPMGGHVARCGYGPRLPLLVLSPYARRNAVDHTLTDQGSVLRFIEDNWRLPRIDDSSFDRIAGPLDGLFDWRHPHAARLILDPGTGS